MNSANPPGARSDALSDVSRRGFLKGAGALAAGPLLIPALAHGQAATDDTVRRVGPGPAPLELKINGRSHRVNVEPRATLLTVLRDQLDLTGAKEVCSRGACGACNVHLNGVVVNACMLLAHDAAGAEIRTIEGLAKGEALDPVQAAFCKHDALQCGYCTPGLVMSVRGLLDRKPKPSLQEVQEACAGNICRCGTYPKVFEAALAAAGVATPVGNEADNADKAWESQLGRLDAPLKVTGKAKFTADVNLPNMAYATILYCPYGRAELKSFSEEAAKKVPGVLDVLVRKRERFKYAGQPAGYICAESPAAIDDALAALNLKWETLEPALDPIAEHEREFGPIPAPLDKAKPAGRGGDRDAGQTVEKAFETGHRLVERTYRTEIQTHVPLEPHCVVADFRGETAEIWCSTQATTIVHGEASTAFGLERNKVTAHCEFVGGGFGSKFSIDVEGRTAIDLSKKLQRPVKIVNSRKREHLDSGCRPGSIQYMKFALDEKGDPVGGHVHVVGVSGPGGGGDCPNPSRYKLGSVVKSFNDLELSVGGARAMRAPGHPQAMFAVDSFVDELAEAAGVDPLEYRKRIDPSGTRKKMYDLGAARIDWASRPNPNGAGAGRIRRGIGMGVADWGNGQGNARLSLLVHKDGTLRISCATQDIGTGTKTVLADALAHHLKIDRTLITSQVGNSEFPPGPPSGGSVVTRSVVPAVLDAADKARAELKKLTGAEPTDTASWTAACGKLAEESFNVSGSFNDKYWGEGGSEAVQFAEVEVDVETGVVRVKKVVALQACGQAINRLAVENQVIGGVIQGVSFALFEEKNHDPKNGAMVNPNMEWYKILGPVDCPEIVPILWAEGENLGARSVGEPPVIPTAGAVANAIANAIGARVRHLPITPNKVLAALAERGGVA
ncbi:MAG: molybdopterin cofactor-binding domain-containing protein [Phycisphaerae bacterium]